MNSVILIGNVSKEPELSYTPNTQTAVTKFNIAVNRPKRNGEDQGADFIRITVYGRQAETCDRYLFKGKQVAVLGHIQTGSYKNREGVTMFTTDVIADRVEFLGTNQNPNRTENASQNENFEGNGYDQSQDIPSSFSEVDAPVPF